MLSHTSTDNNGDPMTNYNSKEMVLMLRDIGRLLSNIDQSLRENNSLMKTVNEKLQAISFNTRD
jgi:hypothetical protein